MKKLFTLALVMLVTFAGFSQVKNVSMKNDMRKVATMQKAGRMDNVNVNANVQSQPNMTRTDGELDYTVYDWQTNAGIINRTIVWPDGKVNFAYTYAIEEDFSDRGTNIGTYDAVNDVWIPLEGRIEDERTGFGSIARYKENGIVLAAHTSTQCGIYIINDKDNMTPNSVPCALRMDPTNDPAWPNVMTSGATRDIIHVIATGSNDNKLYYFRSSDGGQSWDKENVILPYLTTEYGSDWGSNVAYWMETTENNRLALVVSNAWSDCMVIYSDNDGETWERKVFWHHPGINTTIGDDDWALYPRWTSALWSDDGELCLAFEFNGTRGEPASGTYFPGIGGIAYWSENLPYAGATDVAPNGYDPTNPLPPVPGQPFIMDTAYVMNDIYAAWPRWSDQSYDNPYYFGYLCPLDNNQDPQSWADATEFNIEDFTLHGSYNSGCAAMPTLCRVPGENILVAVWSAMDEHHAEQETGNFYYKLFASCSMDGGRTWGPQKHLTKDFMQQYTEHVYLQAAVVDNTLIVAVMADGDTGTFVQSDDNNGGDNLYDGLTYDLVELFGIDGVAETVSNTQVNVYPNPAEGQINVMLNKNAEVTVYNIMGQAVMTLEGHIGANTYDISTLNSGIYFISAGNDTQKFIVK